jgi:hypothetical protein
VLRIADLGRHRPPTRPSLCFQFLQDRPYPAARPSTPARYPPRFPRSGCLSFVSSSAPPRPSLEVLHLLPVLLLNPHAQLFTTHLHERLPQMRRRSPTVAQRAKAIKGATEPRPPASPAASAGAVRGGPRDFTRAGGPCRKSICLLAGLASEYRRRCALQRPSPLSADDFLPSRSIMYVPARRARSCKRKVGT